MMSLVMVTDTTVSEERAFTAVRSPEAVLTTYEAASTPLISQQQHSTTAQISALEAIRGNCMASLGLTGDSGLAGALYRERLCGLQRQKCVSTGRGKSLCGVTLRAANAT